MAIRVSHRPFCTHPSHPVSVGSPYVAEDSLTYRFAPAPGNRLHGRQTSKNHPSFSIWRPTGSTIFPVVELRERRNSAGGTVRLLQHRRVSRYTPNGAANSWR